VQAEVAPLTPGGPETRFLAHLCVQVYSPASVEEGKLRPFSIATSEAERPVVRAER
jgi:hypothetical protein